MDPSKTRKDPTDLTRIMRSSGAFSIFPRPPGLATLLVFALLCAPAPSLGEELVGDAAAGQAKSAMCGGCHGADGNSPNPSWPKLAGMPAAHQLKQNLDFKQGLRNDPMMGGIVMALSDQDLADISAFYATQSVSSAASDRNLARGGEKLYRYGRPREGIMACGGCHGRDGAGFEGGFPGGAPSVRGQHAPYNLKTMMEYKSGSRTNDWNGVMATILKKLSDEEIAALAEYMAGMKVESADE
jgi:cytochrome c553